MTSSGRFASLTMLVLACSGEGSPPVPETITLADPPPGDLSLEALPAGAPSPSDDPNAEVGREINKQAGQFKFCYDAALRDDPDLEGRVVVSWVVREGLAQDAAVVSNTTGSTEFAECLRDRVARWTFAPRFDGSYEWPFVFALAQ